MGPKKRARTWTPRRILGLRGFLNCRKVGTLGAIILAAGVVCQLPEPKWTDFIGFFVNVLSYVILSTETGLGEAS